MQAAAAAKSLQSCPPLGDPIDGSPPGSPIPGVLKAGILEWVAIFFSNAWKWKVKVKSLSRVRLLVTAWTAAYQAPLFMGFSRQEHWSGVPLPSPLMQEWTLNCQILASNRIQLWISLYRRVGPRQGRRGMKEWRMDENQETQHFDDDALKFGFFLVLG